MSRHNPRPLTCVFCHVTKRLEARRLCRSCYIRLYRLGLLHEFPRVTVPLSETATAYLRLKAEGLLDKQIARRMGYSCANSLSTVKRHAVRQGLLPPPKRGRPRKAAVVAS